MKKEEIFQNHNKILEIASGCLNCPGRPCEKIGCPMNTRIPDFISLIKDNKLEEAYYLLKENNMFSYICSKICPQEEQCEGKCVRVALGEPTPIGLLEEYVNYMAEKNKYKEPVIVLPKETHKKVAIIGSGPAGLECALDLKKMGYQVDIYEKESAIGGLLELEIPDFRLDKTLVRQIIEKIKSLGINIIANKALGDDIHINSLRDDYHAIFLGLGAEKSNTYDLGTTNKVFKSSEFLRSYYKKDYIKDLGDTIIIGGGNVAMDCSRAALKMGATTSTICYRRNEETMPARKSELEEALADGVKKEFLTRVISKEEGYINCIRTELVDKKAKDIEGTEFTLKADSVVFAIGLKPNDSLLKSEGLSLNEKGMLYTDENHMTNIEGVFAGGDVIETNATVCRALASGRQAAKHIDEYLKRKG